MVSIDLFIAMNKYFGKVNNLCENFSTVLNRFFVVIFLNDFF